MNKTTLAAIRQETMACWWPSRVHPMPRPNWNGIVGELEAILSGEEFYFVERSSNSVRLAYLDRLLNAAREEVNSEH